MEIAPIDLREFLEGNDEIDFIEVISYRPFQPRCVRMVDASGRSIYLTTEMRDFGNRTEVGVLRVVREWPSASEKAEARERFPGGRALAVNYLRPPDFDVISGVRIGLNRGQLIVTPGVAPYTIFFGLGETRIGQPEFPLEDYRPSD